MAENTGIQWADHTFNPWIGCTKVSPACDHCYAENWNKRYEGGKNWGPGAPRRRTALRNWNLVRKWNRLAVESGRRARIFCASLADIFDNEAPNEWRADVWQLIKECPGADFLLLTKRPQNICKMLPEDWGPGGYNNVWLGTTVENQKEAARRIPWLTSIPAAVHFLSCEPLLGPLEIQNYLRKLGPTDFAVKWVIAGGESGADCRPTDPEWFRSLRDQCLEAGVPFLFKQWGGNSPKAVKEAGRVLDGKIWDEFPGMKTAASA